MSGQGLQTFGAASALFYSPIAWQGRSFNPAPSPLTDDAKSALTGVDTKALEANLFGKDIPLFVGGEALMGCKVIEGPFLTESGSPLTQLASFIVSPCVVATPTATRSWLEVRLNGTIVWTLADGILGGGVFGGMTVNFLTGTETQTPFASSLSRFGARAIAYRSNPCIEIVDCPLSLFNNVLPFVSGKLHEADSITWNDALTALGRYCRFDDSEFEFDVAGSAPFCIVPQQYQGGLISYIQYLRGLKRNWNITATDKLRVFENDASDGITSTITRTKVIPGSLKFTRDDPLSIPGQRIVGFSDTERDYDFNSVTATLERFPIPVTASQGSQTIEVPFGSTSAEMDLEVNQSLLIDDLARKKLSFTGRNALYGTEPGDIVYYPADPNLAFLGRVTSVARKAKDYGTEVTAEQIDFSQLPNVAPVITSNGGGSTASISVAENTTAVTTVTATDANHDLLTYSISGGADAAKFTINAATGVLAFLVAPDFETPTDADTNNAYIVIVQVSDGSLTDIQTITVTVTNVGGA